MLNNASGFGKLSYLFRTFSNLSGISLVLIHHVTLNLSFGLFEYFTLGLILLYAHILFLLVLRSSHPQRTIGNQLTYDFLMLGWYVGAINLSILPSFIFILVIIVNYISVKGFRKLYRLLFIPATCLISLALQGFEIHFIYSNLAMMVALSYGTIHFLIVAFIAFNYAKKYQAGQYALKEQKREMETQKEEILLQSQKLKALNDSLQALNSKLEQKVDQRSAELIEKNKKLKDYAFINAHKLRAPVATILGLVQFFDYKVESKNDEVQIKKRLKNSTKELEQTIKTIRRRLEEEGMLKEEDNHNKMINNQKASREK